MNLNKHVLKGVMSMVSTFGINLGDMVEKIFEELNKYEKEKIIPKLEPGETNAGLVIFNNNDVYYATICTFDANNNVKRRLPFEMEGSPLSIPIKDLINNLIKSIS